MSQPEEWVVYPGSLEMEEAAKKQAGMFNSIWSYHPQSERILTSEWGEQNIVGGRGHWAVGKLLSSWGVMPLESPVFENKGDSYDYMLPRLGLIDVKTGQVHRMEKPDRVVVNKAQSIKPANAYVFCCWHSQKKKLWVLGWMLRLEYLAGAELWEKGKSIPRGQVRDDMFVRPVNDLRAMVTLRDRLMMPVVSHRGKHLRKGG